MLALMVYARDGYSMVTAVQPVRCLMCLIGRKPPHVLFRASHLLNHNKYHFL